MLDTAERKRTKVILQLPIINSVIRTDQFNDMTSHPKRLFNSAILKLLLKSKLEANNED